MYPIKTAREKQAACRCRFLFFFITSLAVLVGLDQFIKVAVKRWFLSGELPLKLTSFLNLVYAENKGISFGLFKSTSVYHTLALVAIAAIIIVLLCVWLSQAKGFLNRFSLTLIIGGAVGNLIDRILRGTVIDFIDFHLYNWHFPAFNFADSIISIGFILIVLQSFIQKK